MTGWVFTVENSHLLLHTGFNRRYRALAPGIEREKIVEAAKRRQTAEKEQSTPDRIFVCNEEILSLALTVMGS